MPQYQRPVSGIAYLVSLREISYLRVESFAAIRFASATAGDGTGVMLYCAGWPDAHHDYLFYRAPRGAANIMAARDFITADERRWTR